MQTSSKLLWASSIAIVSVFGAISSFSGDFSSIQVQQHQNDHHRPASFRGSGRVTAELDNNNPANRGRGRLTAEIDRGSGRLVTRLPLSEMQVSDIQGLRPTTLVYEQDRGSGRLTDYTLGSQLDLAFRGSGRITSDAQPSFAQTLI